jgi:glycerophosphoryl diester phosphodiesterase
MSELKIIGHRGACGLAPENTLASLKAALKHGADIIEFDLRVSKDSVVVLSHDSKIADASGKKLEIAHTTYRELKNRKPDFTTFEEALDAVGKNQPVYIEVKPKVDIAPIVKILKARLAGGLPPKNILLASFSQKILLGLHSEFPNLQEIVIESWSGIRARQRASQLNTKVIAMNQRWLWSGFIKAVSRSGYTLYAYTLNSPAKARRWQKYGLAGAVTDFPDRFKKR